MTHIVAIPDISVKSKYANLLEVLEDFDWTWIERSRHVRPIMHILQDYCIFILCKVIFNDQKRNALTNRFLLSPTEDVEALWQQHLLRPLSYLTMCTAMGEKWKSMNQTNISNSSEGKDVSNETWLIDHSPESAEDPAEVKLEQIATLKTLAKIISPEYVFYRRGSFDPPAEGYQVIIKNIDEKNVFLFVDRSFSIANVKKLIHDKEDILPEYQTLIYAGMVLDDELSLSDYEIEEYSTIQLVIKRRRC